MQEKGTPAKGPDYKEGRVLRSSFLFMKGEEMDDKTIKAILSALEAGEIDLVVGTHALFSQGVEYKDLGLVIADEQHRFGVADMTRMWGGTAPPFSARAERW